MKRCKILMLCLLCGICVIGICVKQSLRKKFYDYNVIAHAGGGIDGHIYHLPHEQLIILMIMVLDCLI